MKGERRGAEGSGGEQRGGLGRQEAELTFYQDPALDIANLLWEDGTEFENLASPHYYPVIKFPAIQLWETQKP